MSILNICYTSLNKDFSWINRSFIFISQLANMLQNYHRLFLVIMNDTLYILIALIDTTL